VKKKLTDAQALVKLAGDLAKSNTGAEDISSGQALEFLYQLADKAYATGDKIHRHLYRVGEKRAKAKAALGRRRIAGRKG
jgi:hypothetical protein